MTRRFFNLLTALSLLLSVPVVALWVRSTDRCDSLTVVYDADIKRPGYSCLHEGGIVFCSSRGQVLLARVRGEALPIYSLSDKGELGRRVVVWSEEESQLHEWGWRAEKNRYPCEFGLVHDLMSMGGIAAPHATVDGAVAPHWSLVAVLSLTPVVATARWLIRRRRHALGKCQRCGYDLRATPDRCPECGTSAAGVKA